MNGAALTVHSRAVALMALMACGPSPDDLYVVSGSTVTHRGEAFARIPVAVARSTPRGTTELRRAQSSDAGTFSFDLVRAEVQPSGPASLFAQAFFPSGTAVTHIANSIPATLELPPFSDWEPELTFADAGLVLLSPVFQEDRPEGCLGDLPPRELTVHELRIVRVDGQAWETSDLALQFGSDAGAARVEPLPLSLPPEVLEDFDGQIQPRATRLGCVKVASTRFRLSGPYSVNSFFDARPTLLPRGNHLPVSRGAPCRGFDGGCPLTDGALTLVTLPSATRTLEFNLPRAATLRKVVLRQWRTEQPFVALQPLSIQVGDDVLSTSLKPQPALRTDLTAPAGSAPRFVWIELPRGVGPGAQVKIELGQSFRALSEVSLFE